MLTRYQNNHFPVITMENDKNHIIKVYSMIHIAPQSFYNGIEKQLNSDYENDYVIHMEGVSGGNLTLKESYSRIAQAIGVTTQYELLKDLDFIKHDMTYDDLSWINQKRLHVICKMASRSAEIVEKNEKIQEKFREQLQSEDMKNSDSGLVKNILLGNSITTERSYYAAYKAIEDDRNVSLVWGKAHAEEIVETLMKNGYHMKEEFSNILSLD